jgi:hypothetical protein
MVTEPVRRLERSFLLKFFDMRRNARVLVIIIAGIVFSCKCCLAADWSFTPSVTLSETYDSNIIFSSTPVPGVPLGDFITKLQPVLSITGQTERTRFELDTITTGEKYVKNPGFDTIDTNTYTSLSEFWSPRFSTEGNFRFIHDYTLESELQTSGIVVQKAERYQYTGGGGLKYKMSETLNLEACGSYIDTMYPTHPAGLPDYHAYQATVTPIWSITPRMEIGLSSNFVRQEYPIFSADINTVTEMISWKRLLSDTIKLDLSAGYYFTWTSFVTQVVRYIPPAPPVLVTKPGSGSDSGPAAAASIKKDWSERFSTTLLASKSQYDDPYARSFDKTSVGFTAGYRLSELTTLSLCTSYDMDDQVSEGNEKINYINISPAIEVRISENLTGRLSGSYQLETYSSQASQGVDIDRYIVWIEFTYKWPRFWATH